MSYEIITPTHPDWDPFVRALWSRLDDDCRHCAGDLHETITLLEEMGTDVAASLEQLDSRYGCHCDCEALTAGDDPDEGN
jgi:hypothetical protein